MQVFLLAGGRVREEEIVCFAHGDVSPHPTFLIESVMGSHKLRVQFFGRTSSCHRRRSCLRVLSRKLMSEHTDVDVVPARADICRVTLGWLERSCGLDLAMHVSALSQQRSTPSLISSWPPDFGFLLMLDFRWC